VRLSPLSWEKNLFSGRKTDAFQAGKLTQRVNS